MPFLPPVIWHPRNILDPPRIRRLVPEAAVPPVENVQATKTMPRVEPVVVLKFEPTADCVKMQSRQYTETAPFTRQVTPEAFDVVMDRFDIEKTPPTPAVIVRIVT